VQDCSFGRFEYFWANADIEKGIGEDRGDVVASPPNGERITVSQNTEGDWMVKNATATNNRKDQKQPFPVS